MNSRASTIGLFYGRRQTSQFQPIDFCNESIGISVMETVGFSITAMISQPTSLNLFQSATAMKDPWLLEQQSRDAVVTFRTLTNRRLIGQLGWSRDQALETRMRLRTFEEDWDAPGMEGYDEL